MTSPDPVGSEKPPTDREREALDRYLTITAVGASGSIERRYRTFGQPTPEQIGELFGCVASEYRQRFHEGCNLGLLDWPYIAQLSYPFVHAFVYSDSSR